METNVNNTNDARCTGNDKRPDGTGLWSVAKSVAAAFFGVQSKRNRERDFQRGKPGQFILLGLIMTVIFIATLWGVVQLILWDV